ncbi:McrB family protein [Plebeiibacterium marinum]|uniref:AAA family ATPase n=1 Tax=Plebeiibacterium marinum TaxID=2992111 RepID=A0AAE3SJE4_9BACT|nr:AAA family ATPase [Plebeiobacterium marinum]MCW3805670.1 AAA family ATPase [Plebeiobacterium marinum]
MQTSTDINSKDYVYTLYNQFIDECVLKSNSILTNENDIFTLEALHEIKGRFIDGAIEGSESNYWEKIGQQFKDADYNVRLCFAHLNWLWYLPANDITTNAKQDTPYRILEHENYKQQFKESCIANFYPQVGIGSAGQYHKTNKPFEISYLLLLCVKLKEKVKSGEIGAFDEVNQEIVNVASTLFDNNWLRIEDRTFNFMKERAVAMQNLMLHLAKPDYYEPIASLQDKKSLKLNFGSLLNGQGDGELSIDDEIFEIRKKLTELGVISEGESFYSEKLRPIWDSSLRNVADDIMALQYKKSIVLYGPPGTGKTYTAEKLAKAFITNHFLHKKDNLERFFTEGIKNIEGRIHQLQFNPNTSYEDFIAGYQLKSNGTSSETVAVKGQLFDIIEKAESEQETTDKAGTVKLPHVLILDEINRVDLSRVFGEFFSAMEYRGKSINTAVKGISLTVPENLYIIGTMNEIDFSVERVDFALRRRFVWLYKGYEEDSLIQMLNGSLLEKHVEDFLRRCKGLNEYISKHIEELGEDYQIGHAFFAELTKIYQEHVNLVGKNRPKDKLYNEARKILWEISIKPMITAFLGNTDKTTIKEYIQESGKIFGVE